MRTILLASTALLITTGIAFAQSAPTTASTTAPAPTGSISSPQASPSHASPGNMAPTSSSAGTTSLSSAATPKGSAASPAPSGAVNAPDVTAAAANASPGKTAPNSSSATQVAAVPNASEPATGASTGLHHRRHWSGSPGSSAALPQDASATAYLHIAKSAIGHHNVSLADDALSHAETRLLDRSIPQGQIAADDSAPVQAIESARQALQGGNYSKASDDIKQAASTAGGS